MLYGIWKWCKRKKYVRFCNALAYYHASPNRWNMLPQLIPPGLTSNKYQSAVNGWFSMKSEQLLGWVSVIPVKMDDDPNDWDIKVDLVPNIEIWARCREDGS